MTRMHKCYDAKLKAKIAIEVLKNDADILEICQKSNVPKTNAIDWKNKLVEEAATIFVPPSEKERIIRSFKQEINTLQTIIGEITVENNFLEKKVSKIADEEKALMLEFGSELSIRKQAELLNFHRSRLYYRSLAYDDSAVANLIRDAYLSSDCRYGYRKVTAALRQQGDPVNSKKVLRIMHDMGIEGLYPKKKINTSIADKEHKIYPYLLNDVKIKQVNQVWATDITYIRVDGFFMYFIAIIDLFSRYIISYDLSNSLEAGFCVATLKTALANANPDIFNTDQGAQFTSNDFIEVLEAYGIKISMDHTGRCFDNIFAERLWRTLKQEAIYYYRPESYNAPLN